MPALTVHARRRSRGWSRGRGAALAVAIAATGLAACGDDSAQKGESASTTAASSAFPVTVTDCGGRTTTYDKAPERAYPLADPALELLATLGLTDKVAGSWRYLKDDKVWPKYRKELLAVPAIVGSSPPSQEKIVADSPDFVISPYQSIFSSKSKLPSRNGWKDFGANAYLLAGDCDEEGGTKALNDFDYLFTDTTELGKVFGIEDRAKSVIADYRKRLAEIAETVKGKKSVRMWTYAGEKTPLVTGASSVPNAIMTQAGVKNVFGERSEAYSEVSFEEVVKRDPEVIWIMPDSGASIGFIDEAEGILKAIMADKRLKDVTAVKNRAFVTISFNAGGIATPQNIEALESLVKQLEPLR